MSDQFTQQPWKPDIWKAIADPWAASRSAAGFSVPQFMNTYMGMPRPGISSMFNPFYTSPDVVNSNPNLYRGVNAMQQMQQMTQPPQVVPVPIPVPVPASGTASSIVNQKDFDKSLVEIVPVTSNQPQSKPQSKSPSTPQSKPPSTPQSKPQQQARQVGNYTPTGIQDFAPAPAISPGAIPQDMIYQLGPDSYANYGAMMTPGGGYSPTQRALAQLLWENTYGGQK